MFSPIVSGQAGSAEIEATVGSLSHVAEWCSNTPAPHPDYHHTCKPAHPPLSMPAHCTRARKESDRKGRREEKVRAAGRVGEQSPLDKCSVRCCAQQQGNCEKGERHSPLEAVLLAAQLRGSTPYKVWYNRWWSRSWCGGGCLCESAGIAGRLSTFRSAAGVHIMGRVGKCHYVSTVRLCVVSLQLFFVWGNKAGTCIQLSLYHRVS